MWILSGVPVRQPDRLEDSCGYQRLYPNIHRHLHCFGTVPYDVLSLTIRVFQQSRVECRAERLDLKGPVTRPVCVVISVPKSISAEMLNVYLLLVLLPFD